MSGKELGAGPSASGMKLVAGMHRSGTSAVARLLFEAGADLGDPATFYPPDRWNPGGYYEQTEIHEVNIPLVNGILSKLAYLFLPSEKTIRRRARSRGQRIRQLSRKYHGKVVKENRFCLTLQGWLDEGAQVSRVLLVMREPRDVALSLRRRNHVPLGKGLSLWETHNRRLLETASEEELPLHLIRYDHLLAPQFACDEALPAFEFMDLDHSRRAVLALVRRVVNPRGNHGDPDDQRPDYPPRVARLWTHLLGMHRKQRRP